MTINKIRVLSTLATVLVVTPLYASAEKEWYVAPGINYIVSDSSRNSDDEFGFNLGIGKQLNEKWNIEANIVIDELSRSSGNGGFDQKGIIVDGLYYINRNKEYKPYFVMGAGFLKTDFDTKSDTNIALNVGVGVERKLTNNGIGLRGDIRYRMDDDSTSVAGQDRYGDWIIGLSVKIPFGGGTNKPATTVPTRVLAKTKPVSIPRTNDGDNDGVIDTKDLCPNSVKNASVDSSGCEVMILQGVNFETNSANLTKESIPILDASVATLKARGKFKVEVAGHTDSQGAASYNRALSAARAIAVRDYLISNGVEARYLSARGYGSLNPIASNNTKKGRAVNRRVELRVQE